MRKTKLWRKNFGKWFIFFAGALFLILLGIGAMIQVKGYWMVAGIVWLPVSLGLGLFMAANLHDS